MTNDSPLCHVIAGMFVMEFKSFASQDKAINFFFVAAIAFVTIYDSM